MKTIMQSWSAARLVAGLTIVSLLMSAFPAAFFVAFAATPIPFVDTALVDNLSPLASGEEDLTGYENLVLSFDYDAETLDNGDSFTYGWRVGGVEQASTSIAGITEGPAGDETDSVTINLPVAAQAVDFEFFVTVDANSSSPSDQVDITNISLMGDEIPPACVGQVEAGLVTGPIQNTDTNQFFTTIQNAVDDCDTEDGHTIVVGAGTYTDAVTVDKELTLEGGTSATVQAQMRLEAANITVNEFVFDGSAGTPVLLRIPGTGNDVANVVISNNVFEDMDITSNNDSAALTIESSDGTTVTGNTFRNLTTKNSAFNRTMQGILIGDTGQSDDLADVTIENNTFTNISGGRGAYGMIVNRETTGLEVLGNTISAIQGNADSAGSGWASGIGLDADTPDALVRNNIVSDVTSLVNDFAGAFGIIGQSESAAESIVVAYNDFLTPFAAENRTAGDVDFSLNWWGSDEGPKYNDVLTPGNTDLTPAGGAVTQSVLGGSIEIEPWLCGPFATDPVESSGGECIAPDTQKPVLTVLTPADGVATSSDLTITVNATDDTELAQVVINLKDETGGHLGTCLNESVSVTTDYTTSCTVAIADWGEGTYQFRTNARDAAGNLSNTESQTFIFDATKPTLAITAPANGETVSSDFTAFGTASDGETEIVAVTYRVNEISGIGGSFIDSFTAGTALGTTNWTFDVTGAVTGYYRVQVRAYDAAGNVRIKFHDVYVDATKPNVTITTPTPNETLLTGTSLVTGTADDEQSDITEVLYTITEITELGGTYVASVERGTTVGTSTWSFETPALTPGVYRIKVQAFDEEGNWRYRFHDVTVVEPPEATLLILAPEVDEKVYGQYDFVAQYDDDDEIEDDIKWAIRAGTCAPNAAATVAGNVAGYDDSSTFVDGVFIATLETANWANGEYCFIVNPQEQAEEIDLRATHTFTVMNNLVCEAGVNLVQNHSFEADEVTKKRGWDLFDAITDWTVEKLGGGTAKAELQAGVFGWVSGEGDQHVELGSNQQTQWSQTILTKPGEEYTLTWQYAPRPNTDKPESRMRVYLDGNEINTNNEDGGEELVWETHSYTFVASDSAVTVMFTDEGVNNGKGALLDDVSLTCLPPAPETYEINGAKWEDVDGDGIWDEGELGIEGWTIYLADGSLVSTTTTDKDGQYSFMVEPGYYEVYEEQREGWVQTAPTTTDFLFTSEIIDVQLDTAGPTYQSCTYSFGEKEVRAERSWFGGGLFNPERCDFGNQQIVTEEPEEPGNTSNGGGSVGSIISRSASTGGTPQVLGASTNALCPYITSAMQQGVDNDPWEVTKLQVFLSLVMGYDNPITGVFGNITDANVKAFQATYAEEILTPWFEAGIVPHNDPTGFVYKTTQWKINDILCPGFAAFPNLEGEDLSSNVDID